LSAPSRGHHRQFYAAPLGGSQQLLFDECSWKLAPSVEARRAVAVPKTFRDGNAGVSAQRLRG
jgi:hypothetical protein